MGIFGDDDDEDEHGGSILSVMLGNGAHLSLSDIRFVDEQTKNLSALEKVISRLGRERKEISRHFRDIAVPGDTRFAETSGFQHFPVLSFFHSTAAKLDIQTGESTARLEKLTKDASEVKELNASINLESGYGKGINPRILFSALQCFGEVAKNSVVLYINNIVQREDILRGVYRAFVQTYRILQTRFQGQKDTRFAIQQHDLHEDDGSGIDFSKIEHERVALVQRNPLLTSVLLDIVSLLPRYQTTKTIEKAKKKAKEERKLDSFEVDQAAHIFAEVANSTYLSYLDNPKQYAEQIVCGLRAQYAIMDTIKKPLVSLLRKQRDARFKSINIDDKILDAPVFDTQDIMRRIVSIDYFAIQPDEEDLKPRDARERQYFAARKELLEYLGRRLGEVSKETNYDTKLEESKKTIERAAVLYQKMRDVQWTVSEKKRKEGSERSNFYVGATGQLGAFSFRREPAPTVNIKDVVGKSFDGMRSHLQELLDSAELAHLYRRTAPRGRPRTNLLAVGPYGCGKTEIVRGIAGDDRFISAEVQVSSLLTAWFGEFEKNVDRVWDGALELRREYRGKVLVLCMDEFDSWFGGQGEASYGNEAFMRVQKSLQQKLDGMREYDGIVVVGLTNEPHKIPLAMYRRFRFVDVVGELEQSERTELFKRFVSKMPLSSGFRNVQWEDYGNMLQGATGDVIGKVADEIHYNFMREFRKQYRVEAKRIDRQIERAQRNGDDLAVKRMIGAYMSVTPPMVQEALERILRDPIIREQIRLAEQVYAHAHDIMRNVGTRQDAALGGYKPPVGFGQGDNRHTKK